MRQSLCGCLQRSWPTRWRFPGAVLSWASDTSSRPCPLADLRRLVLPHFFSQVLHCSHAACDTVIRDPRIAFVNFTGSVAAGHSIQKSASERFIGKAHTALKWEDQKDVHGLIPCVLAACVPHFPATGLELGGKDPAYVRPDCDLDYTVEQLVDGSFFNSGQCCCAIERIYVHESVYDTFVDKFVALTKVCGGAAVSTTALCICSLDHGFALFGGLLARTAIPPGQPAGADDQPGPDGESLGRRCGPQADHRRRYGSSLCQA